jgi:WD40 repeat protein
MSGKDDHKPAGPYKGLMPYQEEDASFFFGREAEARIITANLMASRLTLLYGASGVGKSSVLYAGVAQHLRQLTQGNLSEFGGPEFVVVVFNAWRDDPLTALVDQVSDTIARTLNGQTIEPVPPSRALAQTLGAWTERVDGDLLIILDQFEEYFLYHPGEGGDGSFAVEFPKAVVRPDLRVNFLVSIREDALAKLDRFKGRIPNLFDNYLRLEHLSREAGREAIQKPVDEYNRRRETQVRLEPALIDVVLEQVQTGQVVLGETGQGTIRGRPSLTEARIETPYLQMVMTRLWDEETRAGSPVLRLDTLNKLGGAEQMLRSHLDGAMAELEAHERDAAALIFNYLVTPSGAKIAHTGSDLAKYAELPQEQVASVLEELSGPEVRILRPVAPPPDQPAAPRYEIFHDVLGPAILDWRGRYVQKQERTETEQQLAQERRRVMWWRLGAIGLAVVLVLMVALAVFAVRQSREAMRQSQISLAQSLAALAPGMVDRAGDSELAVLLTLEALALDRDHEGNVGWMIDRSLREILSRPYFRRVLIGHQGWVTSLAFDLDGKILASGGGDGTVRLWDLKDPGAEPIVFSGHKRWVRSVAFSPDGETLASGGDDQEVRLWDASRPNAEPVVLSGHKGTVRSVVFSPDGETLASGGDDQVVRLWDLKDPAAEPVLLSGHQGTIRSVAFSPEGETLASASMDATVRLWDLKDPSAQPRVLRHQTPITCVAFSPDGKTLASSGEDWIVHLWNLKDPSSEAVRLSGHQDTVNSVAFSPNGETLASGGEDWTVRLWDLKDPSAEPSVLRHQTSITSVSISPDGKTLASASEDGTARLWDLEDPGAELSVLTGHQDRVKAVALSPDGETLASASTDATVRLWNLKDPSAEPRVLRGHQKEVLSVAFSPDGMTLASASRDGTVRLWDLEDPGAEPVVFTGHHRFVTSVAFSPNGKTLASGDAGGKVRLWDLEDPGAEPVVLSGHQATVWSVAFSPDGKTLASGGADGTIRLWDLKDPSSEPVVLSGHRRWVRSVAFSPDGKTLASASEDQTVRLWDLRDPGAEPVVLIAHLAFVLSVAFSPDGETLASSGADGTVRLWDLKDPSAEPVALTDHQAIVWSVAFSPDGEILATGSADRTARLWPSPERLVELACPRLRRNLTQAEWDHYIGSKTPYRRTCRNLPSGQGAPPNAPASIY